MPPSAALDAAERWGGGRYQLFRDQATPCVRASVVGRNGRDDATVIADALRAWGAGRPEMRGAVIDGDTVTFTTCVPDGTPPAVSDAALAQAFEHVSLRYELTDAGIRQDKSVDQAICAADELLARPSVTGPLGTITVFGDQYPDELIRVLRTAVDDLVTPPACR
jgi:hypothetical protein